MSTTLPITAEQLSSENNVMNWPEDVPDDAYTLIYTHSKLFLQQGLRPLEPMTLYEAWAFDGNKSWHIWQRDHSWICTTYDTEKDDAEHVIKRKQLILPHFTKQFGKNATLIVYERIQYDEDDQAY